jgi:hypothetical protein
MQSGGMNWDGYTKRGADINIKQERAPGRIVLIWQEMNVEGKRVSEGYKSRTGEEAK